MVKPGIVVEKMSIHTQYIFFEKEGSTPSRSSIMSIYYSILFLMNFTINFNVLHVHIFGRLDIL